MKYNKWLKKKPKFTEDYIIVVRIKYNKGKKGQWYYHSYIVNDCLLGNNILLTNLEGKAIGLLEDLHADEYFLIKI